MAILGVIFNFFMWPFLCVVPWVICFMFGVVWVLDFNFVFLVISICTELFCFGRGIGIPCS